MRGKNEESESRADSASAEARALDADVLLGPLNALKVASKKNAAKKNAVAQIWSRDFPIVLFTGLMSI